METTANKFRYDTSGKWFKGNTHIHSRASDGGMTHEEIDRLYAGANYNFLFATDHGVASRVDETINDPLLLWLDGIEINGRDETGAEYHVVCLGELEGFERRPPFMEALEFARSQGALLILAHPFWCGNTTDDATRWNFDAVEIYNHVCHWLNGKSDGLIHWNAMLRVNPNTLAFAADDAHLRKEHPGWNGGWIMVNANELTRQSISDAIRRGNFYSSCGPDFHRIEFDGETVRIETSPVQFVRLVGPNWTGARIGSFDGSEMTKAAFRMPTNWQFAYLEIEDRNGKRAWTNTLFMKG